jgi:hypothetical protein
MFLVDIFDIPKLHESCRSVLKLRLRKACQKLLPEGRIPGFQVLEYPVTSK